MISVLPWEGGGGRLFSASQFELKKIYITNWLLVPFWVLLPSYLEVVTPVFDLLANRSFLDFSWIEELKMDCFENSHRKKMKLDLKWDTMHVSLHTQSPEKLLSRFNFMEKNQQCSWLTQGMVCKGSVYAN